MYVMGDTGCAASATQVVPEEDVPFARHRRREVSCAHQWPWPEGQPRKDYGASNPPSAGPEGQRDHQVAGHKLVSRSLWKEDPVGELIRRVGL
jgi:hypothetical protein